ISLNYGVEKGEMLFSSIARRLNQICNFNEMLLSRTSRYDFTVYASVLDSKSISQFIENTMTMLINSIEEIYKIYINFNMAAVIYEKENLDIHDATNKLDVCMTNLLKKGSTFEIYNDKYDDCISIKSIEKGIENGEIKVYYQPKVNLTNGKIAGVEALIRWFSEEHGYIPPDKIIEFCEECGYINILGKWILENACRDIKYLNEKEIVYIPVPLFYNDLWIDNESKFKEYLNSVRESLLKLSSNGYKITIIPFQKEFDNKYFLEYINDLSNNENIDIFNYNSYDEVYKRLNECKMIINSRFHGLVLSTIFNKPSVSIVYDHKMNDLLKAIGTEET
ncbi:MAG: EAL domain-containing protein, partial [Peptostreptococcaceae bacterium]|nr:EAL domain-containing protein [Peptostreptococcaceae bacterium]